MEINSNNSEATTQSDAQATTEVTAASSETATAATDTATNKTARQIKNIRRNQKRSQKVWSFYMQKESNRRRKLKTQLEVLRGQIGTKNFKLLKTLATTVSEATKDENGNITSPESRSINYEMLLKEGKNLIVMLREERMREGKRSRKTGTSRNRGRHNSSFRFLSARNLAASSEEVTKTVKSE
jgi:hypothetical protein